MKDQSIITDKNKYIVYQMAVNDFERLLIIRYRQACKNNLGDIAFLLERISGVHKIRELGNFQRLSD